MIVVEDVVGERANFGEVGVPLHQVGLNVELEALLSTLRLVEAAKDEDVLGVDGHAHSEVTGGPGALGIQIDHAPHVVVNVVHFDGVRDFLLVEFGSTREHVNVLIPENARCSAISRHVQICYTAPGIILYVVLLTSCVETLGIVTTNYEYQTPF